MNQTTSAPRTDYSRMKTGRADGEPVRQHQAVTNGNGRQALEQAADQKLEPVRVGPKVGRNDPCPCGSGKKYKQCHGKDVA
jgi:preprotein translocase subunit SecA